jgi:hypothetical protein
LLHVTNKLQQERGRGAGKKKGCSSFKFSASNTNVAAGMRKGSRKEEGEQEIGSVAPLSDFSARRQSCSRKEEEELLFQICCT